MVKRFGYQQVFDRQTDTARGRSCYWTILSKIYSWTRQPWHRQALDLLVACPIGRAHQALQKRKRGQTEKATPYRKKPHGKSICRGILHGHSMTTGNYCIYGMNFSFPVSHPARLPLTTEIARWSTIGPSPDRRNNTEPTCPLLDPVCLIRSVEPLLWSSL